LEDLIGTIAVFAFFILSALIKNARKNQSPRLPPPPRRPPPPPPPPLQQTQQRTQHSTPRQRAEHPKQARAQHSTPRQRAQMSPQAVGGTAKQQPDLEFLRNTLKNLGIDLPEALRDNASAIELEESVIEVTPDEMAPIDADANDLVIQQMAHRRASGGVFRATDEDLLIAEDHPGGASDAEIDNFFVELAAVPHPVTGEPISQAAELFRDSMILSTVFAPHKHR